MTDESKRLPEQSEAGDEDRPAAGTLPAPPDDATSRPTPESQAALTGKAPSGNSSAGTTVPAATADEAPAESATQQPSDAPSSSPGASPPGGASPPIGDPAGKPSPADQERAAKIAAAKARVAATKQAAGEAGGSVASAPAVGSARPGPGAPKAPVKKKEEGPKPADASDHPLVKKLRGRVGDAALLGASTFLGQLSVRVARESIVEVCRTLRDDAETPFNYLSDVTCVHTPENFAAPFEIVYNLYSISANVRVRLKAETSEANPVESVTGVWPAANWMEREVFDLFGVKFRNHPDLRRLLLPPDWEGHPLRKDYPLEAMENEWTARHLPEFTEVQREQIEQRRAYGLEALSTPDERRVREIFRGGKEVMAKELK